MRKFFNPFGHDGFEEIGTITKPIETKGLGRIEWKEPDSNRARVINFHERELSQGATLAFRRATVGASIKIGVMHLI